ncbi:MAG: DUF6745 domain-containing protein [Promethearchaeota archaeon]
MEKKTKELIKNILDNEHLIPSRIWRDILWLQDDESLGISRDRRIVWHDKLGDHEANWQNFFRKSKKRWKDNSILKKLQDYLLFLKGDNLTAREVLSCRNVEIRSLLLNQFGHERLISELKGNIIHQDGDSQLINLDLGTFTEPIRVVKVRDSSTKNYYILRVPPSVKTCKEAIAWTFGLEEDEYNLIKET